MTRNMFNAICTEYTILPALALESDKVIAAIHQNDIDELKEVLESEF